MKYATVVAFALCSFPALAQSAPQQFDPNMAAAGQMMAEAQGREFDAKAQLAAMGAQVKKLTADLAAANKRADDLADQVKKLTADLAAAKASAKP